MSRESIVGVLEAFLAVYELRTEPESGLDAQYLGNLPAECRPATSKRAARADRPTGEIVRRTVIETRHAVNDPSITRAPLLIGRNLYVLLDEEKLPGAEDVNRALRPFWSVLWRLAARGHYIATQAPVRERATQREGLTIEYRDSMRLYTPDDFPTPIAPMTATVPVRVGRRIAVRFNRVERARRYLAALPAATAGQHGDLHTFRVCCRLVRGFALTDAEALTLLTDWNARCEPPWAERELRDKLARARRYGREPLAAFWRRTDDASNQFSRARHTAVRVTPVRPHPHRSGRTQPTLSASGPQRSWRTPTSRPKANWGPSRSILNEQATPRKFARTEMVVGADADPLSGRTRVGFVVSERCD